MTELHRNYIAGEWVEGEAVPDINPSNTDEIVGHYARASAGDAQAAIAAAKAAAPAWSRSGIQQRHDILKAASDEILARREEIGRLLSREEGKTLADGIGETVRAGQIFDFFAGETLRLTGDIVPSVRPGIDVTMTREAGRRRRHHHAVEFPDRDSRLEDRAGARLRQHRRLQAGRPRAGLGLGDRRHPASAPACRRASSTSSWAAARWSARRSSTRPTSTPSPSPARSRPAARSPHASARAHAQVPARDGRQEPARRARRRRPQDRRRVRRQRRLFPDRPALHRLLAPDRDGGHPRQVRRAL